MRTFRQSATRAIAVAALICSSATAASSQDLVFQKGFSDRLNIPGPVQNVAVGDPDIFDVQPLTQNVYLLNAKKEGTTNLLAVDDLGNIIYSARLHVRPVDIWPGFPMRVTYGVKLSRTYVCDRANGCPADPVTYNKDADPTVRPTNIINGSVGQQQTTTTPGGSTGAAPVVPAGAAPQ